MTKPEGPKGQPHRLHIPGLRMYHPTGEETAGFLDRRFPIVPDERHRKAQSPKMDQVEPGDIGYLDPHESNPE